MPSDIILMISWLNETDAADFEGDMSLPPDARFRRVRVVRDYGMLDRREGPQYDPEIGRQIEQQNYGCRILNASQILGSLDHIACLVADHARLEHRVGFIARQRAHFGGLFAPFFPNRAEV
jgi:hypothetical protein